MPPQPARGRHRRTELRPVVDAIFYLLQSGYQWGLLPKDFPPKSTLHFIEKSAAMVPIKVQAWRLQARGPWKSSYDL
jgi:transposase